MNINVADYKSQMVSRFYLGIRKASCSPDAAAFYVCCGQIIHCLQWLQLLPSPPLLSRWQTAGNICFVPLDDLMVTFGPQKTCFPLTLMHRNKGKPFVSTGENLQKETNTVLMSRIKSSVISKGIREQTRGKTVFRFLYC